MSRPGSVQQAPATPADYAIVATLVDHETGTHTDDGELQEMLASQGRLEEARPTEADIVHTHGVPSWNVCELARGSLVEPSEGATAIYRLDSLSSSRDDELTRVRLSGPGIPDTRTVYVGLPATELEDIAVAQSTYPRGVDALFTAGDRIVAIPRTGSLEVA